MVCAVTANKPMAAAKQHNLWLESRSKHAYIMWGFAKAPQVLRLKRDGSRAAA